jgi:hypothetical protein
MQAAAMCMFALNLAVLVVIRGEIFRNPFFTFSPSPIFVRGSQSLLLKQLDGYEEQ